VSRKRAGLILQGLEGKVGKWGGEEVNAGQTREVEKSEGIWWTDGE